MFQQALLQDSDVEPLGAGVARVLDEVGILCQNAELLRALAAAGARVDLDAERAWFPKPMVTAFADQLRSERSAPIRQDPTRPWQPASPLPLGEGGVRVRSRVGVGAGPHPGDTPSPARPPIGGLATSPRGRGEAPAGPLPRGEGEEETGPRAFPLLGLPDLETQVAQFVYDDERRERRSGNKADLVKLIQFGDALHGDAGVGHCLLLTDVPPLVEPLEAGLLLAEHARKPHAPFAWNVRQIPYLSEMGEALGLRDWFNYGAICFAHPLRFDRDVADRFVHKVRAGSPTGLTAMPVAGITAPVTLAGFVVVSAAEHLATWLAARALNPAVRLGGSMWAGTVDMRTGATSYCAFDAMLYAFATVEFLRRWTGVEVPVGGGEYCDAKVPGLYTALEKAYKAMTIAAFTGQHPGIGCGHLENGRSLSAVQLLLERDLTLGAHHYARTLEATPELLGMDEILDVGLGLEKCHLGTEHTVRHFRASLWLPELLDRVGWGGVEHEEAILAKARERARDLAASYCKPSVASDTLEALRRVVGRARRELL